LVLATVLWIALLPVEPHAQNRNYDALVAFGDSLSDTGNLLIATKAAGQQPAIPPSEAPNQTYFRGRFSNGPVAIEYLWGLITGRRANGGAVADEDRVVPSLALQTARNVRAASFAFGGSGSGLFDPVPGGPIPGFQGQIELFRAALTQRTPPPGTLYVIFTGANDYIGLFGRPTLSPATVVSNIANGVRTLHALGARHVMVMNLPDLGVMPFVPAALRPVATAISVQHNALLADALNVLSATLPDLQLRRVDVFSFLQRLLALGAVPAPALPLSNATCLFTNPSTCTNASFDVSQPFLFWDVQHPTTAAHDRLGEHLYEVLGR
jgi:phospholipase/lecithinase/hemolysin